MNLSLKVTPYLSPWVERDYSAFNVIGLRNRELGFPKPIGAEDALAKSLYSCMRPTAQWNPFEDLGRLHGGVFNLEFSPEGNLLVAACEKQSILIFDPLTQKKIHTVKDAHSDCVNCVKFLDGRMFATCSDDTTIALWDIRNLKKRIRTLHGHSNWVKNIEYSVKDNLLVTSGLDGSIYTWDINSYTEWSLVYQRVFHAAGLMRCRITPDASQMVMCTTGGLIIIIHNLNLSTLAQDLHGFKPNMYRLMQMSLQHIPVASCFNHLFERRRKRNRVEFITDFPAENDAEVVSSLQIHPQGWCALSRNISHNDKSEWTCIHDIQPDDLGLRRHPEDYDDTPPQSPAPGPVPRVMPRRRLRVSPRTRANSADRHSPTDTRSAPVAGVGNGSSTSRGTNTSPSEMAPSTSNTSTQQQPIQNDVWEATITIKQQRLLSELHNRGETTRSFNMQRISGINTGISPPPEVSTNGSTPSPVSLSAIRRRAQPSSSGSTSPSEYLDLSDPEPEARRPTRTLIHQNKDRLLYHIKEPNLGKGFIKELCFSSDGRLVCSPFGYGCRLLSMSESCSEISHCPPAPGHARPLVDLGQTTAHADLVVSSKFSPRHCLLVTGCLAGRIVWYQPCGNV